MLKRMNERLSNIIKKLDARGTCGIGFCYKKGIRVLKRTNKKASEMWDSTEALFVGHCYKKRIDVEKCYV